MTDREPALVRPADRLRGTDVPRRARRFPDRDRTLDPVDLVRRVKPFFGAAGITRVADLTGLDRIGIPVALAVRPNARSLSVSQGKGCSREQAVASAVMEAMELAAAERLPGVLHAASIGETCSGADETLDLARSTRCRLDRLGRHEALLWTEGYALSSGAGIMVPWALVGIDYRADPPGFHSAFQVSTDGLASGATADDAILHALCELIERDASALLEFAASDELTRRVTPIDTEETPDVIRLKASIEAAGCVLTVIDMTSDIGVPAFTAVISDAGGDDVASVSRYAHSGGSGCHPVRSVALVKAIVEAAQSRITRIAGSRDDLPASLYGVAEAADREAIAGLLSFVDPARPAPAISLHNPVGTSPAETVRLLVETLRLGGIEQVVAVPIANDFGISVVRVIVPGLQTELTGLRSKIGRRALVKLLGRLH